MKFIDIRGQRFGRLIVIKPIRKRVTDRVRIFWKCRCDCGGVSFSTLEHLKDGDTQSCGCLQRERASQSQFRHGGKGTREYIIWKNIKSRCLNPNHPAFKNYGGRGIIICNQWKHDFGRFIRDMGKCPSQKHAIERIDNDGNYTPSNCEWAIRFKQANNTRRNVFYTLGKERKTLGEWSRKKHISYGVLFMRLHKLNWSVSRTLNTPVRKMDN